MWEGHIIHTRQTQNAQGWHNINNYCEARIIVVKSSVVEPYTRVNVSD